MKIAEYFASMSVRVDAKSIANVDKTLKNLENRLKAFTKVASKRLNLSIDIANFKVDPKRLETALGSSLDKASNNVVFEIKRFAIDQRALRAAMLRATRATTVNAPVSQRQVSAGGQSQPKVSRPEASYGRANYLHAGGAAGALARYGVASLPFVGGVYGLGSLNKANQELVSSNISAQSVLGTNSGALLDRLAERTDYLGVNYRETIPQFTKFMASASPMLGQDKSFDIFQSFLQFGRTRGATDVSMNRALTAVGQMSAKGQVMAEELKNQLGDAGGFGELPQLFAEAYQIKTGGNLKGGDARAALMKAMERGEVKTADALPLVTQLMDELSKGGIEAARNSSVAQQARAQNAIFGRNGLLQRFSEGGGETGFARMWGALAIAMKESAPIVDSLTRGFETFSRKMSSMMLLPQSIMRAFQGRDSWFGDAVGTETVDKLKSFIEGIGEVFDELKKLTDTVFEGWGMLVPAIVSFANKVKDVFLYTFKMFNALLPGGEGVEAASNYGKAMQASLAGKSPEEVKAIAAGEEFKHNITGPDNTAFNAAMNYENLPPASGLEHFAKRAEQSRLSEEYRIAKIAAVQDKDNPHYNDPKGFDAFIRDRMQAAQFDASYYSSSQPTVQSTNLEIKMDVKINAANPEDFNQKFQDQFKSVIQSTLQQYSQKE
ncbi:MAG: hypothetical protein ACRC6V_01750 [Bacteroidales bacterium]